MRDVLISLKPYYYYLIGEGIKKVEVRKSYPKAEDWSRNSWFYMSRDEKSFAKIPKQFQEKYRKHFGKVGMRFVCDCITPLYNVCYDEWEILLGGLHRIEKQLVENACLTEKELHSYASGKRCYGWHITDLVVYDEPRELSEFSAVEKKSCPAYLNGTCLNRTQNQVIRCEHLDCKHKKITHSPQSLRGSYEEVENVK